MLGDFGRGWSSQEVQVNNASDRVVLKILASFCSVVDLDVHAVAVQEENTVGTICTTVIEVHWVVSVEIAARGNRVSITRPEGASVVGGVQL